LTVGEQFWSYNSRANEENEFVMEVFHGMFVGSVDGMDDDEECFYKRTYSLNSSCVLVWLIGHESDGDCYTINNSEPNA